MTMTRNLLLTAIVILLAWIAGRDILMPSKGTPHGGHDHSTAGIDSTARSERIDGHADRIRGPHGGWMLEDGDFALEVTLFEEGTRPEFRVYPFRKGEPMAPEGIEFDLTLERLGGVRNVIGFSPAGDYLLGDRTVAEPHSFNVTVTARVHEHAHTWTFESHEGRTLIPQARADAAGVQTELAGPQMITETRTVTGYLQVPPDRVAQVRARFPGVVETVHGGLGNRVSKGDVLVTVQSNDSLRSYTITAPISGSIVAQDARPGETTDDMVLFMVADTSRLWAELDLFPQDLARMRVGQMAHIETLSGETSSAPINWISPLAAHPSQSVRARVPLGNADRKLRPGQFVSARVVIAENEVPLAVRHSALQRFRDKDVVFARFGETYEIRMIDPGRADDVWLEVTDGLRTGTEYVIENSYLIKADIEKSGATHDH